MPPYSLGFIMKSLRISCQLFLYHTTPPYAFVRFVYNKNIRVIFDTCIIMDAIQNREPFAEDAKNIVRAAANKWFTGCITAKSSADIYYLIPSLYT